MALVQLRAHRLQILAGRDSGGTAGLQLGEQRRLAAQWGPGGRRRRRIGYRIGYMVGHLVGRGRRAHRFPDAKSAFR